MGRVWPSIERAEEHFGMEIPDESTLQRLEDHERVYGRDMHDWIAEGMPAEIMGSPKGMEAFRQRQADRPPEVPTNIERQNRRSVQRSEKAAVDTSPAGETGVPEPVREVISSRGRSLDGSIQRAMEDQMGDSFGDVRVHTGSTAAAACESINARAFTVGNHIAFNSGEYDPSSPEGQHVLAHELAHVRQQNQGAVSMLPQEDLELEVDPDPALEREAEETAQQVMEGGKLGIQRLAGAKVHVQRMRDYVGAVSETVSTKLFGEQDELDEADFESLSDEEVEAIKKAKQSGGPDIAAALTKALIAGAPATTYAGPEAGIAVGGTVAATEFAEQSAEYHIKQQLESIKNKNELQLYMAKLLANYSIHKVVELMTGITGERTGDDLVGDAESRRK